MPSDYVCVQIGEAMGPQWPVHWGAEAEHLHFSPTRMAVSTRCTLCIPWCCAHHPAYSWATASVPPFTSLPSLLLPSLLSPPPRLAFSFRVDDRSRAKRMRKIAEHTLRGSVQLDAGHTLVGNAHSTEDATAKEPAGLIEPGGSLLIGTKGGRGWGGGSVGRRMYAQPRRHQQRPPGDLDAHQSSQFDKAAASWLLSQSLDEMSVGGLNSPGGVGPRFSAH